MVRNPPYLTTFPIKSHKGTTFYKTAGEKADKKWDCPGAECHLYYQRLRAEVAFSPLSQICVHFHANVCAFSRKRLRPRFQTFALAVSNVCVQIGQKSGMEAILFILARLVPRRDVVSGMLGEGFYPVVFRHSRKCRHKGCSLPTAFLFLSYRQAFSRIPHCS